MEKLYKYSKNVYSQNGEDGIIEHIFNVLEINEGVLLEIGAWDGYHFSNIVNLWSNDEKFKAVLIEGSDRLKSNELHNKFPNVHCFKELASLDNSLEKMLNDSKFDVTNDNFVLASIDIDGDDLNVTRSLGSHKPKVLIVESNGDVVEKKNPIGSTIKELVDFGSEIGYELIGMSGFPGKHTGNLFFIREDLKNKFPITELEWNKRGILLSEGIILK